MHRLQILAFVSALAISQAYQPGSAQDLDYVIVNEQVAPIPLPFQAAVFRRAFRNATGRSLAAEYPAYGATIVKVGTVEEGAHRAPRGDILDSGRISGHWNGLSRAARLVPLSLEPGQQSTICYSFAAEWVAVGTSSGSAAASLFPEAGTYSFRLYDDDELRVVVREPEGDDKLIVDQLRADPDLAAEMMEAIGFPSEEMLRALERIVKLYPESSYADYARFAMGRHYALAEGGGALRRVPEDRRVTASVFLSEIEDPFAYAPEALILHYRILKSLGRDSHAGDVMTTLRRDYADSAELLNFLVRELGDEKWIKENPWRPTPIPKADQPRPPNLRP